MIKSLTSRDVQEIKKNDEELTFKMGWTTNKQLDETSKDFASHS